MSEIKKSRTVAPRLKPKHFDGLATQLTDQGLTFDIQLRPADRTEEIFDIGDGEQEVEEVLAELEELRPYTRVIANPQQPSAHSLLKMLCDAQDSLVPDESISINYGLPEEYVRQWSRECTRDGDDSEGQRMVLVAFDQDTPVGYAGFGITLLHDKDEGQIFLGHTLELVYVHPSQRGKGFGIDLSIACSRLCQDVLIATYRAAPSGYTIVPAVNADFESEGGERFTQQLALGLDFRADMLRMDGRRRSITITSTDVDAGY